MDDLYGLDEEALEERLLEQAGAPGWPSLPDALAFARERHGGQRRKGRDEPYLCHLLRTTLLLLEVAEQRDLNVLCAGLLHDVVEDTAATADEVEDRFGPRVGDLVRALTHSPLREAETRYERNMRDLETLRWEGRDAQVVKSADRLDNLRTMDGAFSPERAAEYLRETREGMLPLTLACNTALYHAMCEALERAEAAQDD